MGALKCHPLRRGPHQGCLPFRSCFWRMLTRAVSAFLLVARPVLKPIVAATSHRVPGASGDMRPAAFARRCR